MPVRPDLRHLYPLDWPEISRRVRFTRAGGRCENCGRPHGAFVVTVRTAGWRVVLAACHRDHDPSNVDDVNLAAWCQPCHLTFDTGHHQAQRRITLRSRWALADLFDGPYSLAGYPRNV